MDDMTTLLTLKKIQFEFAFDQTKIDFLTAEKLQITLIKVKRVKIFNPASIFLERASTVLQQRQILNRL